MYIFAGEQDEVVRPWATREIKRYFEELGGNVEYVTDPELGHDFREATAAGDIGKFCYDAMGAGVTLNEYETGDEFMNNEDQGTWGKFDQFELA
jgi:hypothetical protein